MSEVIVKIQQVAEAALAYAETLTSEWLPDGSRQGSEWVARNMTRGDRSCGSFGVSLATGKWNDFADRSAHGGDLVSLYSYLNGCRQVDAAMAIDRRLGLGVFRWHGQAGIPDKTLTHHQHNVADSQRQRRKAQDTARALARQEAIGRAKTAWERALPASPHHPYLASRQVPAFDLRQCRRGSLLIPLYAGGEIVNLQRILPDGTKRFLKGGQVQGAYALLGRPVPDGRLFICEGWATGATLHHLTGDPVVCAMHAGNLLAVAKSMRTVLNSSLDLVIAGDDDRQTSGNPGRQAANDAALAVGALVLYPEWPDDCPENLTDFNDLYRWYQVQRRDAGGGHD
ncbi:toprim domain-containing protein [Halomonas denitrificans]|uniref:toprim domain-containing protein n=1 Tax=Halomonas denitrificans TaxID=370769 RepID=UPI001CD21BE4|nr:toprim domain-containing protein [Halomonas denitrificans]MCA0975238.1 toprim domain-containing protein [Halomonas denitrificans]